MDYIFFSILCDLKKKHINLCVLRWWKSSFDLKIIENDDDDDDEINFNWQNFMMLLIVLFYYPYPDTTLTSMFKIVFVVVVFKEFFCTKYM